jgi:drug/metabolite transporter (DMT)-like permease
MLLLPYIALIASLFFWGLSFIGSKIALTGFTPFALIFIRFGVASLFFIAFFLKRGIPRLSRRDHWRVFATSLVQPWLYFIFETNALRYTSASKVSLIIATIPIFVLIITAFILKKRPSLLNLIGILGSLIGVALLVVGDDAFKWEMNTLLGDLLIFGAVISAALYIISMRGLVQVYSAIEITGLQFIYGALLFAPEFLWELPGIQWSGINSQAIIAISALTLFATVGAFGSYNYALSKISATKASIYLNGVPVVTVLGGWAILGERLSSLQFVGAAVILIAVLLTTLNQSD